MTSLKDIRSTFLGFFEKNGHTVVPSAPLVPRNDPTLMFNNAGMVPFKNVFTGAESRAYTRAVSSQKCVRAGGKHNDLDNVGYTARHLTFFEMLGNFSFGDYFKETAIELAWELVTRDLGLSKDRLLVTVFEEDDVAFDLWKKIAGFEDDRIIRIGAKDNFWAMGDTGPCGPCSELFYDHGPEVAGGPPGSPDEDGDRFVEFWNLVFMQFDQVSKDERVELPKPSIDTGMGLERMATVLQGVHSIYETDLFQTLIKASEDFSGTPATGEHAASHRIISDHLRSSCFLIADGVLPSNEGRGYVLRRIMRRAMRHAHLIGAKDPLLHRLVSTLVAEMGQAYGELQRAEALITATLEMEETRFRQTLDRGLKLLEDETKDLKSGDSLAGETAFKLYDTYGFPLDLTEDALRARGISVDTDGFDAAMARQKAEARAAWAGSGDAATEPIWFELRDAHGATDFLGYDTETAEGQVLAIVAGSKAVDKAETGSEVSVIVNQTPFYAESGGQVGDQGVMTTETATVEIADTQKRAGDLWVHTGKVTRGTLKVGDEPRMIVDAARRKAIRSNHSATHLLHAALRERLGEHVTQKGSLVAPDRLRFDISHPKAVERGEMSAVETDVNAMIRQNSDVTTRLMTPEDAIESGAMALFGEKYGDEVRVLTMGVIEEGESAGKPYSVELCGGTHVRRTGDIGLFKVIGEGAVSAGVRRIEAVTGEAARQYLSEQERLAQDAAAVLKTTPQDLPGRIEALVQERKKLERELADAKKALALGGGGQGPSAGQDVQDVAGVKVIARTLDGVSAKDLRGLVDDAKKQVGSGIVAYVTRDGGKAALAVGVTDDLTGRFNAVDLVRKGAEAMGGKGGGGRADMAQAGGPDASKADDALKAITDGLKSLEGAA